jgi:hypothetical protein
LPGDRPSRSNITEHFDLTPEIRNCFFASIQDQNYLLSDKILLKKFLMGVDRSSRENDGIGSSLGWPKGNYPLLGGARRTQRKHQEKIIILILYKSFADFISLKWINSSITVEKI